VSGEQAKALREALIAAYDQKTFEMMLRERLGKQLPHMVNLKQGFSAVVHDLVRVAEQEGWIGALIRAALRDRPGNAALRKFRAENPALCRTGLQHRTTFPAIARLILVVSILPVALFLGSPSPTLPPAPAPPPSPKPAGPEVKVRPRLEPHKFKNQLDDIRKKQFDRCMALCMAEDQWERYWRDVRNAAEELWKGDIADSDYVEFIIGLCTYSGKAHLDPTFQVIPEFREFAAPDGGSLEQWLLNLQNVRVEAEVCEVRILDSVSWWLLFVGYFEGLKLNPFSKIVREKRNWRTDEFKRLFRDQAQQQFDNQKKFFDDEFVLRVYARWYERGVYDDDKTLSELQQSIRNKARNLNPWKRAEK
jgi:hypothetical protein